MSLKLSSLINNFLTSGVTLADPQHVGRIKILNVFELVFVLVAPLLGLFYFYIGVFSLFYISVIAGLSGMGVILVLRMTRNLVLTGNLAVAIVWSLLLIIRWSSGGISSESMILLSWVWNGVLILLAIFVCGYLWGTAWACVVFIESGLAVTLFRNDHSFPNLIPLEISPVYSLGLYLTGLLAILLFAFLYEKERADSHIRENAKTQMLLDTRNYMESILERLPVPTFILDTNHRVIQWNRACHELTGIGPQDILGKRVWEGLFLDEEGSMADKLLENPDVLYEKYEESVVSMTESGSFTVDTVLPKLKGGLRSHVRAAPILDQDGRVRGAIQTIQDVGDGSGGGPGFTGDSIDDSVFPIFKIDSKGKISGWNTACEESYGYSLSQMLGKSPLSVVSKPYRRNFRDTIVQVLKGASFRAKEWKYQTSEGKSIYVLAKAYPVPAASGESQDCVVINTDITDIKLKLKKIGHHAVEREEKLRKVTEDYNLLTKNVASFLRKKKVD